MTSRGNEKRERQIGEERPEESKGDFPKEVNKIMRRIKCEYSRKKKNRPPGHSPLSSLPLTFYDTAV